MTTAIHTDTFLPHPRERVWQAFSDPERLAAWLMPNDFAPRVGHRFTFRTDAVPGQGFDGVVHCQVLAVEPPRLLRISWASAGLDTTVTWRLEEEGRGTRLFLDHEGFDPGDARQQAVARILGGGWRGHLARRLEETLAGPT